MKRVDATWAQSPGDNACIFVTALPKTRSGKLLRRAIQAVCEGRDAGDLTTMDDPAALQQIRDRVASLLLNYCNQHCRVRRRATCWRGISAPMWY
ncbi:hypothetical protein [Polaromonas sp. SM01]|uniref:hypothetical protein n=1 Tax=Polaromonas sp. SM01 TaxID=3085630 RepID=UPI00399044EA